MVGSYGGHWSPETAAMLEASMQLGAENALLAQQVEQKEQDQGMLERSDESQPVSAELQRQLP